ncbi:hypothetical protein LJC72_11615 [Bacteroides sp. OttesenSCG-928-D19]|nr:hypothetical protein [Bacteroides sp. OttesenSCG-928-N06]MDL2305965.1 hypothetical protein [Bacteroides sp. OttesenSCG-928-D19]
MENRKRQYRELDDMTKQKISMALRGRSKSISHTEKISDGLKKYWETIPNKPANNNENNTEQK